MEWNLTDLLPRSPVQAAGIGNVANSTPEGERLGKDLARPRFHNLFDVVMVIPDNLLCLARVPAGSRSRVDDSDDEETHESELCSSNSLGRHALVASSLLKEGK